MSLASDLRNRTSFIKLYFHILVLVSSSGTAGMQYSTIFLGALAAACLLQHSLTSPLPQGGYGAGINNDNVPGIPVGPAGATGSPYGPESLLGNDGSTQNTADSSMVSNYELVPGQGADADVGLYLDFSKTSNPQPIRGSNGYTDAGPRMNTIVSWQT